MKSVKRILSIVLAIFLCFGSVASAGSYGEGVFATRITNNFQNSVAQWLETENNRSLLTALLYFDLALLDENAHLKFWDISDCKKESYISATGSQVSIYICSNNAVEYSLTYDINAQEGIYTIYTWPYITRDLVRNISYNPEGYYQNNPDLVSKIIYEALNTFLSSD